MIAEQRCRLKVAAMDRENGKLEKIVGSSTFLPLILMSFVVKRVLTSCISITNRDTDGEYFLVFGMQGENSIILGANF